MGDRGKIAAEDRILVMEMIALEFAIDARRMTAEPRGNHADRRSGFDELVDRAAIVETELAITV